MVHDEEYGRPGDLQRRRQSTVVSGQRRPESHLKNINNSNRHTFRDASSVRLVTTTAVQVTGIGSVGDRDVTTVGGRRKVYKRDRKLIRRARE